MTDLEQPICVNAALRRATRRMGQLYDDAMAPLGIKGTQFSLLYRIQSLENPSLRMLATDMVMDISALGHTLKPLTRDGLIKLIQDPADKRAKRVHLTAKGAAIVKTGIVLWRKAHKNFETLFGAAKTAQLRQMLESISMQDFADRFTEALR